MELIWRRRRREPRSRGDMTEALKRAPRCLLLTPEASASVDCLLGPWLARQGVVPELHRGDATPGLRDQDFVIVSRYLTPAWRKAITAARERLSGFAYFMDDDLLDPQAWSSLPRDYRHRLHDRIGRHTRWLEQEADTFWVSTDALATKYAALSPRVLPLAPLPALLDTREPLRLAYHGTTSHRAEIEWLRPVIAEVLNACPDARFEIFGDQAVYALYRDLPRVTILYPMKWPQYLAYTAASRCDIGLVPLLPSAFNAARGAVKFFDLARMGAVGLYADSAPYRGFVRPGIDGVLVETRQDAWRNAVIELASDRPRLRMLARAARERALHIASGKPDCGANRSKAAS